MLNTNNQVKLITDMIFVIEQDDEWNEMLLVGLRMYYVSLT